MASDRQAAVRTSTRWCSRMTRSQFTPTPAKRTETAAAPGWEAARTPWSGFPAVSPSVPAGPQEPPATQAEQAPIQAQAEAVKATGRSPYATPQLPTVHYVWEDPWLTVVLENGTGGNQSQAEVRESDSVAQPAATVGTVPAEGPIPLSPTAAKRYRVPDSMNWVIVRASTSIIVSGSSQGASGMRDVFIDTSSPRPSGLAVVFTRSDDQFRYQFSAAGLSSVASPGVDGNTGFSWRIRQNTEHRTGEWGDWQPGENTFNTWGGPRQETLQATTASVDIDLRAQNTAGSISQVFNWTVPTVSPLDPQPPGTPAVSINFNPVTSRVTFSWESNPRGTEWRYYYLLTKRDGSIVYGPATATQGVSSAGFRDWGTATVGEVNVGATDAEIQVYAQARNLKLSDGQYQVSATGSASRPFDASGGVLPPQEPIISFDSYLGNTLSVSWVSARAATMRYRTTSTDDKGVDTVSNWSAWDASTSASITAGADIVAVTVEVQARNGNTPDYNVSTGTARWVSPLHPPAVPTAAVSNVTRGTDGWYGTLTITSEGATSTRYQILAGSTVITAFGSYAPQVVYSNVFIARFQDAPGDININIEARNTIGSTSGSSNWDSYGGVGAVNINAGEVTSASTSVNLSWSAASASEFQYAIQGSDGQFSQFSDWAADTSASLPFLRSEARLTVRVHARKDSTFAFRSADITVNRPGGAVPPSQAPEGLRVSLTLSAATHLAFNRWSGSWSAQQATSYRYQVVLTTPHGTFPGDIGYTTATTVRRWFARRRDGFNVTQIELRVWAVNSHGTTGPVSVQRATGSVPAAPSGAGGQAEPDQPVGGQAQPSAAQKQSTPPPAPHIPAPTQYQPPAEPPPKTAKSTAGPAGQQSATVGEPAQGGLVVVRHSQWGRPFQPL